MEKREEKGKGEKKEERKRRGNRGWSLGRVGRWFFLILVVVHNYGVVGAASDNVQNRGRKLEGIRWEKEMVRNKQSG